MGFSSVVISLYNYNFCGYEQGLAAHFSYLSNGRDRPQDRFLLAYSEHNRLLFRDLYLMHTYTERSRATKTLFPLLANSLLPVPEEKKSVVAWWWLSLEFPWRWMDSGEFWKRWRKREFVRFGARFEIVGNINMIFFFFKNEFFNVQIVFTLYFRRILKLCEIHLTLEAASQTILAIWNHGLSKYRIFLTRPSDDSYDFSVIMTPLSVIYKFVYFRCEKTDNLCVSGVPLSNIFPRWT